MPPTHTSVGHASVDHILVDRLDSKDSARAAGCNIGASGSVRGREKAMSDVMESDVEHDGRAEPMSAAATSRIAIVSCASSRGSEATGASSASFDSAVAASASVA